MSKTAIAGNISVFVMALIGLLTFLDGFKVIEEGEVGVVTRFKEYNRDIYPGISFKIPFVDDVVVYETRELKATEQLSAATKDQLAIGAVVTYNWRIDENEAAQIFTQYGNPNKFLNRIITPRVVQAAKETLGKFTYEDVIQRRGDVTNALGENLDKITAEFPVFVRQGLIEDVNAPEAYKEAVRQKQIAQQEAEREKHKLARQKLEAQQRVNTAEAEAEAKRLAADAEAYRIRETAKAEAHAVSVVGEQLNANPRYIEFQQVEKWNGQVPKVTSGDGVGLILPAETVQ